MSRVGRQPIEFPQEVKVKITNEKVLVQGPKGTLDLKTNPKIKVKKKDEKIIVERVDNTRAARSLHGLTRTLIANMIKGVTEGFSKNLELKGVGYRASLEGEKLVLKVGFSHPVRVSPPQGIKFAVGKNKIKVLGIDKQLVGNTAAMIRKIRPPDPYKGKGIRYEGEEIKKKPGKAAKAVGLGGRGE